MRIDNALLDLLISRLTLEYAGTHCPHRETPLYGRRAYWRVYLPDGTYVCKLTAPVRTLNPKPATLAKLFRAELKSRIESIGEVFVCDHYGRMQTEQRDPSSVRRVLEVLEGKYYELMRAGRYDMPASRIEMESKTQTQEVIK